MELPKVFAFRPSHGDSPDLWRAIRFQRGYMLLTDRYGSWESIFYDYSDLLNMVKSGAWPIVDEEPLRGLLL